MQIKGIKLFQKSKEPLKVVATPYSVYQADLGNYFFGQTEPVFFGGRGTYAWGGLINPAGSGVRLFWNVYTISNYSKQPFTTEFWLNSTLPGKGNVSRKVASANQAIEPVPQPKVQIHYKDGILTPPADGYFSFVRRVEPLSTLTRHDFQGMIIIPSGGSVILFLKSSGVETIEARIAFGWWEQGSSQVKKG